MAGLGSARPGSGVAPPPPTATIIYIDTQAIEMNQESAYPESPFAKFKGTLSISNNGNEIDCYVLDNEERVMSIRAVVNAIAGVSTGKLDSYIGVKALEPYIDKTSILGEPINFSIPGTQLKGIGINAEKFLDILTAYISAFTDGKLETDNQKEIAIRCIKLNTSLSKVGLIALIDEATGYQNIRQEDELQIKLRAFLADELRDWEKTFPDELWNEFGRLTNWEGPLHSRPKYWGKLVMELIYDALDPDVALYLKNEKPKPQHRLNYHQWLTENYGLKYLSFHIQQVIGVAKTCDTMDDLRQKVAYLYKKQPMQIAMSIPPVESNE